MTNDPKRPYLLSRLRCALTRFRLAERGNVAITFAFATLPVIGLIGSAVDYSRANAVKVSLQSALDSTALMLAKDAPSMTSTQLQSAATKYFQALFTGQNVSNPTINARYTTDGGSAVIVNGSIDVPTTFLDIVGVNSVTVDGSSTTKWGSSRLRVALVLDVTGSMASDGKMTALKSATKNLLTTLKNAATNNGDVYVSIIPFNKDVNVGAYDPATSNLNWVDWTEWDANNQTCTSSGYGGWGWGGNGWGNTTCTPKNHNTWNGCVTDRDQDYDQLATAPNPDDINLPNGKASTLFPAEQYSSCPVAMMGLSYNWSAMNSLVDSMQPVGNTNQPIGLVWGWQSLVGGGPLTAPAMDSNYQYQQIIILLSDGMNTQDRWYSQQTPVDNRMYQTGNGSGTCANIKAAGVTIYTLQVNTGRDPTSTLLKNCASASDKFFLLTQANDISSAFDTIGTNLTKLRVAK
ncbi:MAG: pilus assembly protein TadG [Rhodopseudomonas sp.]|nr:pilus assembly protein TadG [Rhodopseudomonas sp.]